MSYFKAKMHQIQFLLELCPDPTGGAYSTPLTPQLDLRGLLLREGRGGKMEGKGKGGKSREKAGRGRGLLSIHLSSKFATTPPDTHALYAFLLTSCFQYRWWQVQWMFKSRVKLSVASW